MIWIVAYNAWDARLAERSARKQNNSHSMLCNRWHSRSLHMCRARCGSEAVSCVGGSSSVLDYVLGSRWGVVRYRYSYFVDGPIPGRIVATKHLVHQHWFSLFPSRMRKNED